MTSEIAPLEGKKWIAFLVLPGVAGIVYHYLLSIPGLGFSDAMIVPFLLLLAAQFLGTPAAYLACLRRKGCRSFPYLVILAIAYALLGFWSIILPIGQASWAY